MKLSYSGEVEAEQFDFSKLDAIVKTDCELRNQRGLRL